MDREHFRVAEAPRPLADCQIPEQLAGIRETLGDEITAHFLKEVGVADLEAITGDGPLPEAVETRINALARVVDLLDQDGQIADLTVPPNPGLRLV